VSARAGASATVPTGPNARANPRALIGVPLYNGGAHLAPALDSLLGQEGPALALVLVDDCSSDGTPDVARSYAAADPRVSYERNASRLGLVGNWRRAYERACELHPEAPYFAWGSDHDVWRPGWLAALVEELDGHPEAVGAYPQSVDIDAHGVVSEETWSFDTRGIRRPRARVRAATNGMAAGKMVYGLFRAEAVARAGTFRFVLNPDRLFLAELAAQGELRQVPEVLWHRRLDRTVSIARQRAAFFPAGAPLYSRLPWWLVHTAALAWALAVRGQGDPAQGPADRLTVALEHARAVSAFAVRRRIGHAARLWRLSVRRARRGRRALKRRQKRMRVAAGALVGRGRS